MNLEGRHLHFEWSKKGEDQDPNVLMETPTRPCPPAPPRSRRRSRSRSRRRRGGRPSFCKKRRSWKTEKIRNSFDEALNVDFHLGELFVF